MIASILSRDTCKACQICCRYDDNDIWDAPGFTSPEIERAREIASFPYYEKRGLFFCCMEKEDGQYNCPLLSPEGCRLEEKKPFKCAIWPLYVVNLHGRLALAISNVCPTVSRLSNESILTSLGATIQQITQTACDYPELVEPMRPHFRKLCFLDQDSLQNSNSPNKYLRP